MTDDKKKMSDAIEAMQNLATAAGIKTTNVPPGEPKKPAGGYEYSPPSGVPAKHERKPLTALDTPTRRYLELLVWGLDEDEADIARKFGVDSFHTSLEPTVAGDIAGLRRRRARWLLEDKFFQQQLTRVTKAKLEGAGPAAVDAILQIMNDKGENNAADRTVRLKAASIVIGRENGGGPKGVTVNVSNTIAPLAAGIVIRLPQNIPAAPLETNRREQVTIDAEAIEADDALEEMTRRNPRITEG